MSQSVSIFGSDAAALLAALHFQKQGSRVTLFDPGQHFDAQNPRFWSAEVPFWRSTESNFENLAWLENLIDRPLGGVEIDAPPTTFDGAEPKSFIGFGDKKYTSIPAVATFNIRARLRLNASSETIYQRALECFTGEIRPYSEVSSVQFGADGIESVQINGGKDVTSDLYVFCLQPDALLNIFGTDILPNKIRGKIARTQVFSKITLDSKPVEGMDADGPYIFLLPPQNDHQPCIGTLLQDRSVWHSFCPIEDAEDAEGLANQVRHMRKLIEKALPALAEPIRAGSISLQTQAFAEYDSSEIRVVLKKSCNNAILAPQVFSHEHGLTGCVASVVAALADFQVHTQDGVSASPGNNPSTLDSHI